MHGLAHYEHLIHLRERKTMLRHTVIGAISLCALAGNALAAAPKQDALRSAEAALAGGVAGSGEVGAMDWPAPVDISMGPGVCAEAQGWLPSVPDPVRLLALWDCWGGENQRFELVGGVLYVGKQRAAQVVPALGDYWPGCTHFDIPQRAKAYSVELCTGQHRKTPAQSQFLALTGTQIEMQVTLPRQGKGISRGAPLLVTNVDWRNAAKPFWQYDETIHQLRAIGTDLCLMAPPAGAEVGAPLYLETCALAADQRARSRLNLLARAD